MRVWETAKFWAWFFDSGNLDKFAGLMGFTASAILSRTTHTSLDVASHSVGISLSHVTHLTVALVLVFTVLWPPS
jgi:hypothetical protein